MSQVINMKVNGEVKEFPLGISFEEIANEYQQKYDETIVLAVYNGKIHELWKKPEKEGTLTFLTLKEDAGYKSYVRSAIFLLIKAIYDVVEEENIEKIKIEFSMGGGYFVRCMGNFILNEDFIIAVKDRMNELVTMQIPITKKAYSLADGIDLFERHHMGDKIKLLKFRRSSSVNVYELDGIHDYFYGHMLPNTSYIRKFDVCLYESGILLSLPTKDNPGTISQPVKREKLFQTLDQSTIWGMKMGIDTVGDLNNQICNGGLDDLILVQEALQESRIGDIAADIVSRGGIKFVMIAGPSSSGKTTFSHRLSIQLKTHGLIPHPIAVDDYFVNREKTPRDENGDFNFECLEAIDIEQFNDDMKNLLLGNEVELPSFNFKTGFREYKGNVKKLGPDDVLVIEGIHALNDKMSFALPAHSKYKIYISALTTLNVDEHNRIPTTDGRLLRRMVRDARTRGASAKRTIEMWPSVRKGEEENIFPYQESADAMFNSTLIYELAVLKQFAEPLLFQITEEEKEYFEARRLLKFLEYFLGISSENLPKNSIIREFVGGSCLNV